MFLRWLLKVALLTVAHALASGIAVVFAIAAAMSPGGDWLAGGLLFSMFFPLYLLDWAGVELVPLDSPLAIAVNSPSWVVIVSAIWFVGCRSLGWKRNQRRGAEEAK